MSNTRASWLHAKACTVTIHQLNHEVKIRSFSLDERRRPGFELDLELHYSGAVSANHCSVRRDPGYAGLTTTVDSLPASFYFDPAHHQRESKRFPYRRYRHD